MYFYFQHLTILHDAIYSKEKHQTTEPNLNIFKRNKKAAILIENPFIDRKEDATLLKQDSFFDFLATGHVQGITAAFFVYLNRHSSFSLSHDNSLRETKFSTALRIASSSLPVFLLRSSIEGFLRNRLIL